MTSSCGAEIEAEALDRAEPGLELLAREVVGVGRLRDDLERGELALEQLVPHQPPVLVVRVRVVRVGGREEASEARVVALAQHLAQLVGQPAEELPFLARAGAGL